LLDCPPRDVGFGDWGASIVEAIGAAKLVVMILLAAANASPNVLDEVVTALDAGATVIPFRIEDIRPTGALRLRLSRLHWLDALSPPFDQHIDRLIEIAKRILPAAEAEGEAAPPRQEEQPRQPVEELLRLLQVAAESQRPQEVPPRKQVCRVFAGRADARLGGLRQRHRALGRMNVNEAGK
jgi:TIR domain